ncbi:MAG: hypothetical protein KBT10_01320 [Bacteroidales bacterium]|nr:hypothetical protein [Candidatus Sodaliphilus aphodohippi]
MMDIGLLHAIADGKTPTLEQVNALLDDAPYFVTPLLLYLKEHGVEGNGELLSRLAIAVPDRRHLATQLGDSRVLQGFYPPADEPTTPDTDIAIDRFLDNYGNTSPKEVEAISNAIFNPMPDYADILAAEERKNGKAQRAADNEQDKLIDNFINEQLQREKQVAGAPAQPHIDESEKAEIADESIDKAQAVDDSMLSESLAKTYITQHKYRQALEIIENINLRYPEKSIYFADQIRFLKKLILNETTLNNK